MKKVLLTVVLILLINTVFAESVYVSDIGAHIYLPASFVISNDDEVVAVDGDVTLYASPPKYEEGSFLFVSDQEHVLEENKKSGFELEYFEEIEGFETEYLKFYGYKDGARNVVLYYTVVSEHEMYFAFASERRLEESEIKEFDDIISDITFDYTLEGEAAHQVQRKRTRNTILTLLFVIAIVMLLVSAMNRNRPEYEKQCVHKCDDEIENICPNCRKPYRDGEEICTACGIKISEWKRHGFCNVCGGVIPENASVCSRCGAHQ